MTSQKSRYITFCGKTFEAKDSTISSAGTAEIYADSAIALDNTNLNADYGMYLTGGKVDIAHSRLTSPVDNYMGEGIAIKGEETNVHNTKSTGQMGGHSLTLTDTTVESGEDIVIEAGKVALDGSTMKSHEETVILAAESITGSMKGFVYVFVVQMLSVIGSNCIPIPGAQGVIDYLMLNGFAPLMGASTSAMVEIASRGLTFYFCIIICLIIIVAGYYRSKKGNKQ